MVCLIIQHSILQASEHLTVQEIAEFRILKSHYTGFLIIIITSLLEYLTVSDTL